MENIQTHTHRRIDADSHVWILPLLICLTTYWSMSLKYTQIHTETETHTDSQSDSYTNTQAFSDFPILSSWALTLQAVLWQPKDHTHHNNTNTSAHTSDPHSSSHTLLQRALTFSKDVQLRTLRRAGRWEFSVKQHDLTSQKSPSTKTDSAADFQRGIITSALKSFWENINPLLRCNNQSDY